MSFTITMDHTDDESPLIPRRPEESHAFRMFDDDGVLYFTGFSSDRDSDAAFAPLDGFGRGYGCTSIAYLVGTDNRRWVTL